MSTKNTADMVWNAPCMAGIALHHRVVRIPRGEVGPAIIPMPPQVSLIF